MSERWPYQTSDRRRDGYFKNLEDVGKELKLKIDVESGLVVLDASTQFNVKTLNGMCGIMLVSDIYLPNVKEFFSVLDSLAEKGNYTYIMISHHSGHNFTKSAEEHGYKRVQEFYNRRSGNNVVILMKEVKYD